MKVYFPKWPLAANVFAVKEAHMRLKVALVMIYVTLTSCTTLDFERRDNDLELRNLDYRVLNLQYEFQIQKCFYQYDFCVLKKEDDCWQKHEKCVIEKTKFYKHLLKVRGFEK